MELPELPDALVIKDLTKCFVTQDEAAPHYALKGVNLCVKRGEIFGIIGMSGAGKSTLLRCLLGLERATSGQIWIGGKQWLALSKEEGRQARQLVGVVFQNYQLLSARTALSNVTYPLEIAKMAASERKERACEMLRIVGLAGKEGLYPSQLSGGEKQRVALARALVQRPVVLLCDEPTAALDPYTTHSILDLLRTLNQELGVTLVLITHAMEVVKTLCDRVAVLEHGEIVEEGRVVDVFTAPQHPTTRRFLHTMVHDLPPGGAPTPKESERLRLFFSTASVGQPLITQLVRTYNVDVNILLGAIDQLKEGTVGNLVIELSGPVEERRKARTFLEAQGVTCKEMGLWQG